MPHRQNKPRQLLHRLASARRNPRHGCAHACAIAGCVAMSGRVALATDGQIAHVTLSHAGKFNAMSRAMWAELRAVFIRLQQQADLRCVVVHGEGGHFCAGGDISEYSAFRFAEASLQAFHEGEVWGALQAMLDCDWPLVAQIEGNCMGAGLEIAACCDLRLAAPTARFGVPIARLGFPMAPRELALLLRTAGELTTRELLLSAAVLGASELAQRGFLSQVLPAAELASAVQALAGRICTLAPLAARQNKQCLRALAQCLIGHDAIESVASQMPRPYAYADSAEHREGIRAFVGKRPPVF